MDCDARVFELPSDVASVCGVPARRPTPMAAQELSIWTPALLGAAVVTAFNASREAEQAMALKKRDA